MHRALHDRVDDVCHDIYGGSNLDSHFELHAGTVFDPKSLIFMLKTRKIHKSCSGNSQFEVHARAVQSLFRSNMRHALVDGHRDGSAGASGGWPVILWDIRENLNSLAIFGHSSKKGTVFYNQKPRRLLKNYLAKKIKN